MTDQEIEEQRASMDRQIARQSAVMTAGQAREHLRDDETLDHGIAVTGRHIWYGKSRSGMRTIATWSR